MWQPIVASLFALPLTSAEGIVTVCRNTYGTSDFLIQVIPFTSAVAKRQEAAASGYLDHSGFISHNCQQGSTWSLSNAQLSSNGLKVSVSKSVASARFSTSATLRAENTKFATTSDFLFWDNMDFQSGTARFCAGTGFNTTLTAIFNGPIPPNCVQATLRTIPVSSCHRPIMPIFLSSTASAPYFSLTNTAKVTESGKLLNVTSGISNANLVSTQGLYPSYTIPNPSGHATSHAYGTGTEAVIMVSSNSSTMAGGTGKSSATGSASVVNIANSSSSLRLSAPSSLIPSSSSTSLFISNSVSALSSSPSYSIYNSNSIPSLSLRTSNSSFIPSFSSITSISTLNAGPMPTTNSLLTFTSTFHFPSSSKSIPPFQLASSVIGTNSRLILWCSSYLGYDNVTSPATVTVETTILLTIPATIVPAIETTTRLLESTKVSTLVTPSDTTTIDITPSMTMIVTATAVDIIMNTTTVTATTNDFSQIIQKRQATHSTAVAAIPSGLQIFQPGAISNACSQNVPSPSAVPTTMMTETFMDIHTHYVTASQGYRTIDVISQHDVGIIVKSGHYNITKTGTPHTYRFTTTTTTTERLVSTAIVTKTNTVPTVILAHPTAIVGSINGSIMDYDDFAYNLTTPFKVQMYGNSTNQIWVSTNGLLSLYTGSWFYNNAPLPRAYPIPNYCIFPLWDDTYIYQGQPQGIYYEVTGDGRGTRIAFEFYLSHYHGISQYYHYTVSYDSASPGIFVVRYYQMSDNGTSATIGMQHYDANQFTQFSYNTPDIYPGLELTLNSNTGLISPSSFDISGNTTSDTG